MGIDGNAGDSTTVFFHTTTSFVPFEGLYLNVGDTVVLPESWIWKESFNHFEAVSEDSEFHYKPNHGEVVKYIKETYLDKGWSK